MTDEPAGEFQINVRVEDGVGTLEWGGTTNEDVLTQAVGLAADDAIMGHGVRRVEVYLPAGDSMARRCVHRAGFRLEGVRREAHKVADEAWIDVAMYSRLAGDLAYGAEGFSGVMNSVLPRKRAMAHALFRDEQGRLLFLKPHYKDDWELPGGILEREESPREGCEREVAEELGIEVSLPRLLCVDWLPPHLGWEDALGFVFDGGVLSPERVGTLVRDEGEIADVHWVDADEAASHLIPGAAARLRSILPLLDDPSAGPLYLERGDRVE